MFTAHFNLKDVRVALGRIVEKAGPDHKATNPNGKGGCTYAVVSDGTLVPVCIIGQFFANLGLLGLLVSERPDLDHEYEPSQAQQCNSGAFMWDTMAEAGVTFDEDARHFMRTVQQAQDSGATWNDALAYAVADYKWKAQADANLALGLPNGDPAPLATDYGF